MAEFTYKKDEMLLSAYPRLPIFPKPLLLYDAINE